MIVWFALRADSMLRPVPSFLGRRRPVPLDDRAVVVSYRGGGPIVLCGCSVTEPVAVELDVAAVPAIESESSTATHNVRSAGAPPQSLKRTIARVAPCSLLIQVLSFGSSMVMATQLGARTSTDAYYLALSVPVVVYTVLMAAIRLGGIPGLTAVAHTDDRRGLQRAASELLSATFVASVLLSIFLTLRDDGRPSRCRGRLCAPARADARVSRRTLPLRGYGSHARWYGRRAGGACQLCPRDARARFRAGDEVRPVAAIRHQLGVQALVIGNLVGNFLAVLALWAMLVRRGVLVRPRAFWSSKLVRGVFTLSAPLVLSQSLLQLNPLIDRTTAEVVGPGSVTVFELGVRLFTAPMALLTATLIAPLAASWSSRFQTDGWQSVTDSFGRGITASRDHRPPLVVAGLIARHDLVQFAYSSHAYTPQSVDRTANVLGALLVGMVAQIMIVPLSILFVIRGDTIFPLKVGIANCVLNAALDLALRGPLGVTGIAASTAITMIVLCGVYIREARKRWGPLGFARARLPALRSGVSCTLIAGLCLLVQHILPAGSSRLGALAGTTVLGAVALLVQGPVLWMAWRRSRAVPAIGWIGLPSVRTGR